MEKLNKKFKKLFLATCLIGFSTHILFHPKESEKHPHIPESTDFFNLSWGNATTTTMIATNLSGSARVSTTTTQLPGL